MAVSDDPNGPELAAVGYPYESVAGPNTGVIVGYYEASGLVFENEAAAGDAQTDDYFGFALAAIQMDGSALAIVGAPGDRSGAGAAYMYTYDALAHEWTKAARWSPDELNSGAQFGWAVACAADQTLAASAPLYLVDGLARGAVYVRSPSGLDELIVGPLAGEAFGAAIAMGDDCLVVGASGGSGYAVQSGVVYVYSYDDVAGWTEDQRIAHVDSTSHADFGASLAKDGGRLLIGAPEHDAPATNCGAVYVYESGTTWQPVDALVPDQHSVGDRFGTTLALAGDVAVVGAPGDDSAAPDAGSVHLFRWTGGGWVWEAELTAADAEPNDAFGSSIALSGDDLFIGAKGGDAGGEEDVGATYAYRRFGDIWTPATERIIHADPVQHDACITLGECYDALVFVSGMLLKGAVGDDGAAPDAGAVIVTDYDAHIEVPSPLEPGPGGQACSYAFESLFDQRFDSPVDPSANSYFADHVDVSGDVMAIAESYAVRTYINTQGQPVELGIGGVHIYRRTAIDQWTFEQSLFPPQEHVYPYRLVAQFGQSMALDGDWLLVGHAYGDFVYVYQRTRAGWVTREPIQAPTDPTWQFGADPVGVSGNLALISDSAYQIAGCTGNGALFFYEYEGGQWTLKSGPVVGVAVRAVQPPGHPRRPRSRIGPGGVRR